MASREHLQILRQGTRAWNHWRHEHPDIEPNLTGADLFQWDLQGSNLAEANLKGADLRIMNLSEADLRGANLSGTLLFRTNLREADLHRTNLRGADLRGVRNLTQAQLDVAAVDATTIIPVSIYMSEGQAAGEM